MRSRFYLGWIVALVFCMLTPVSRGLAESDAAFTGYTDIVEAVFPAAVLSRKHVPPTARQKALLETIRKGLIELIRKTGPAWFEAITFPETGTEAQFREVLAVMEAVPIWICTGSCSYCRLGTEGCAASKRTEDIVASVLFLNTCLFSPGGCKKKEESSIGTIFRILEAGLATTAYAKFHGSVDLRKSSTAAQRAGSVLAVARSRMKGLIDSCPGPFPESGLQLLRESGHVVSLSLFANDCGTKLINLFKRTPLPESCVEIIDPKQWDKKMKNGLLKSRVQAIRCDEFCEALTCGAQGHFVARPMRFGSSEWYMSIPEGSCEGASPVHPREFATGVLRSLVRPKTSRSEGTELLIKACVKALVPDQRPVVIPAPVALPDGPSVELIK